MRLSPLPPATTANLISCLQGALAAYFIGRTVSVLLGREGAASSLAAVFFALSPLTWEYSVGAEVFCLNNLLISVVIFLTTCICSNEYDNKDKLRCAKLGAFVSGLCLSNQHTSLLFLLVLIPVVYSKIYDIQPAIFTLKTLSLFFLLGLSPYIYLCYASSPHDGSWGDLSSIDGFIKHLTRSEYGSLKLAPTDRGAQEVPLERIWIWLIDLRSRQIGYIGVAAAVVGLSRSAVNRQLGKQLTPLLLTLVFYTVIWNFVFSNLPLDNSVPMAFEVHSRFWMQPNIIVCVLSGVGFSSFESFFRNNRRKTVGTVAIALLLSFMTVQNKEFIENNRNNSFFAAHGSIIIDAIPSRSLLISHTDIDWNSVRFLRTCEPHYKRKQITHISAQLLPYPWFQRQVNAKLFGKAIFPPIEAGVSTNKNEEGNAVLLSNFMGANLNKFKGGVYLDMQGVNDAEIGTAGVWRHFALVPHGLVYRIVPRFQNPREASRYFPLSYEQHRQVVANFKNPRTKMRPGTWEFAAISIYYDSHYQFALTLLTYAIETKEEGRLPDYIQKLGMSSALLSECVDAYEELEGGPLSYPKGDLYKNAALSHMRFVTSLEEGRLLNLRSGEAEQQDGLPKVSLGDEGRYLKALKEAIRVIELFLENFPEDSNAGVFVTALNRMTVVAERKSYLAN